MKSYDDASPWSRLLRCIAWPFVLLALSFVFLPLLVMWAVVGAAVDWIEELWLGR